MTVFVVTYDHKHGQDLAVTASRSSAESLIRDWMRDNMDAFDFDEERQAQVQQMLTGEPFGNLVDVWAAEAREYFRVSEHNVLGGAT